MDGLSAVLDLLRLRGVVYFHSDFCDAWGMDNAEVAHMSFHLVVSGHCTVTYEDQIHTLHQGDIVIFPHGTAHQIKAHTEAKTLPGNRVGQSILEGASLFGEGEVTTTLICGHFEVDRRYGHPFLQQLPVALIVQGQNQAQLTWMELTIRTIMEETKSHEAGADLVSTRLAEVLLIRTLRQYLKQTHHAPTYLRALEDERLSRVLARIHQDPSGDHSLETLAHEAGMSRTLFATQFKQLMGESPGQYTTRWRMLKAQEYLQEGDYPVRYIARQVGYKSEPTFNRAFKQHFGESPGAFRKRLNQ